MMAQCVMYLVEIDILLNDEHLNPHKFNKILWDLLLQIYFLSDFWSSNRFYCDKEFEILVINKKGVIKFKKLCFFI